MKTMEYIKMADSIKLLYGEEERPHKVLRELKSTGELNKYFDETNIMKDFERILRDFISIVEDPNARKLPYYTSFCLYSFNSLLKVYSKFYFDFGLYFSPNAKPSNEEGMKFRSFVSFFRNACKKFEIEPYAHMNEETLHIFLRDFVVMSGNAVADLTKFQYKEKSKWYAAAEQETYDLNKCNNDRCFWVTRDYGELFGYNFLIHRRTGQEELIGVKSSVDGDSFPLSRYERKVMYESADCPNTSYLIYKFKYTKSLGELKQTSLNIYRYDKENNVLVDVDDEDNICTIDAGLDFKRDKGRQRIIFYCYPKN